METRTHNKPKQKRHRSYGIFIKMSDGTILGLSYVRGTYRFSPEIVARLDKSTSLNKHFDVLCYMPRSNVFPTFFNGHDCTNARVFRVRFNSKHAPKMTKKDVDKKDNNPNYHFSFEDKDAKTK